MVSYYKHLNDETNKFINNLNQVNNKRKRKKLLIHWITKRPRFIYLKKPQLCLNQLKYIFDQVIEPDFDDDYKLAFDNIDFKIDERRDLEGMKIIGEGGTGNQVLLTNL